jgi:tubulin polyglutamylase TTLL1
MVLLLSFTACPTTLAFLDPSHNLPPVFQTNVHRTFANATAATATVATVICDTTAGKWSVQNFRKYLEGTRGQAATDKLFEDMNWICLQSLMSVQSVMLSDRHCFEVYGYDLIVDDELKPWLIEVNASPSLSATTISDRVLKYQMLNDTLNIVCPDSEMPDVKRKLADHPVDLGQYEILYDETMAASASGAERPGKGKRPGTSTWK